MYFKSCIDIHTITYLQYGNFYQNVNQFTISLIVRFSLGKKNVSQPQSVISTLTWFVSFLYCEWNIHRMYRSHFMQNTVLHILWTDTEVKTDV